MSLDDIKIAPLSAASAGDFVDLVRLIDFENPYAIREKGEEIGRPDMVAAWLAEVEVDPYQTVMIAATPEEWVGYLIARGGGYRRLRHNVTLMMGLVARHHGQGIGSALLEKIEAWARMPREGQNILRLELSAVDINVKAIDMYKRFGFVEEGIKRKSVAISGAFHDEILMAKWLA